MRFIFIAAFYVFCFEFPIRASPLYQCNFDDATLADHCFTTTVFISTGFTLITTNPPDSPSSDVTAILTPTSNGELCKLPYQVGNYSWDMYFCYRNNCPTLSGNNANCTQGQFALIEMQSTNVRSFQLRTDSGFIDGIGKQTLIYYYYLTPVRENTIKVYKEVDGRNETIDTITSAPYNGWIKREVEFNSTKNGYKIYFHLERISPDHGIFEIGLDEISIWQGDAPTTVSTTTIKSTSTSISTSTTTSTSTTPPTTTSTSTTTPTTTSTSTTTPTTTSTSTTTPTTTSTSTSIPTTTSTTTPTTTTTSTSASETSTIDITVAESTTFTSTDLETNTIYPLTEQTLQHSTTTIGKSTTTSTTTRATTKTSTTVSTTTTTKMTTKTSTTVFSTTTEVTTLIPPNITTADNLRKDNSSKKIYIIVLSIVIPIVVTSVVAIIIKVKRSAIFNSPRVTFRDLDDDTNSSSTDEIELDKRLSTYSV